MYDRAEPGKPTIGFQVTPPSSLKDNVKFEITTPAPYAVAVHRSWIDGPEKTPPFGAVTFTSGWSRSSAAVDTLASQRRAVSRIAARVGLVGFRFVAVESIPVTSKAKYARRDGVPPHTRTPPRGTRTGRTNLRGPRRRRERSQSVARHRPGSSAPTLSRTH